MGQAALRAGDDGHGDVGDSYPTGTVGALGDWANGPAWELGVTAGGTHGAPQWRKRLWRKDMSCIFCAAVETPWCYLEFGQVGWF